MLQNTESWEQSLQTGDDIAEVFPPNLMITYAVFGEMRQIPIRGQPASRGHQTACGLGAHLKGASQVCLGLVLSAVTKFSLC